MSKKIFEMPFFYSPHGLLYFCENLVEGEIQ